MTVDGWGEICSGKFVANLIWMNFVYTHRLGNQYDAEACKQVSHEILQEFGLSCLWSQLQLVTVLTKHMRSPLALSCCYHEYLHVCVPDCSIRIPEPGWNQLPTGWFILPALLQLWLVPLLKGCTISSGPGLVLLHSYTRAFACNLLAQGFLSVRS